MNTVLLVAEHDGTKLNPAVARAVRCAARLPDARITLLVFGDAPAAVATEAASLDGVHAVRVFDAPGLWPAQAEVLAPLVVAQAAGASHVLAASTTTGKDLMPRVAALLDTPAISDIMEVLSARRFKRPTYAGNVIQTVEVSGTSPIVGTVRTASFEAVGARGNAPIETVAVQVPASHSRVLSQASAASDRPDLQSARRVVSGGRAFGSAGNFKLVYDLADALGAAVGASRAAVDAGYVPNELQVGQTGKVIAPELYIALGISGAVQHLSGIKDAGTIVAINRDDTAPIFEVADIGLVADVFEAVPRLQAAIEARKRG